MPGADVELSLQAPLSFVAASSSIQRGGRPHRYASSSDRGGELQRIVAVPEKAFGPAAASSWRNVVSVTGAVGCTRTDIFTAPGSNRRSSSSRFATTSADKKLIPVTLPAGRARLETSPSLTGSSLTALGGDAGSDSHIFGLARSAI